MIAMPGWPTILRSMWVLAALVIAAYAGGSIFVRPVFPNGWLNSGLLVVPACLIYGWLLFVRSRKAWIAGMVMMASIAIAIVLVDLAYERFGMRTLGLCLLQLICVYSIWGLKEYEEREVAS
jgi:ABC-type uncharacterized transport system permease subunit